MAFAQTQDLQCQVNATDLLLELLIAVLYWHWQIKKNME